MITRTDIAAQLEASCRVGYLSGASSFVTQRELFVQTATSDGAFEIYADMFTVPMPGAVPLRGQRGYTGDDARTGAPKTGGINDGGSIPIVDAGENSSIIYNQDWPVAIGITHNAINDNRVGSLEQWAQGVGARYEQHKDWICFQALNAGTATTYGVASDKLTFFNDAHITPGAAYQTAQDNNLSLALSLTNYDTAWTAGSSFLDENGHPLGRNHSLLIVANNLNMTAAQIVTPITPNINTSVNPYAGVTRLIVAPGGYLDTSKWILVDPNVPQKPIILQEREAPNLVIVDDDFAGIRYFIWKARYAVGYGDWRLAVKGGT